MDCAAVEKTEEDLRKEIDELHRQQREISERLRDPRGIRRAGLIGPRNLAANGVRQRDILRSVNYSDRDGHPPPKRRLSSAVVKVEDEETVQDAEAKKMIGHVSHIDETDGHANSRTFNGVRRSVAQGPGKLEFTALALEHMPRILPRDEDPTLLSRNKRMLGSLLGTLEKFRKEDVQLSGTEAYIRRSTSLQRAEKRAREESEKLRQQERELMAERRRRDLTLRARVAAKAQEKKLELLFLRWSRHHNNLSNFRRTKVEPAVYFCYAIPLDGDEDVSKKRKEERFLEWKSGRRAELSEYQKGIAVQYMENVEKEMERWTNVRRTARMKLLDNDGTAALQQSMDQELEIHRLEHGPKKCKIPPTDVDDAADDDDEDDDDDVDMNAEILLDDLVNGKTSGSLVANGGTTLLFQCQ